MLLSLRVVRYHLFPALAVVGLVFSGGSPVQARPTDKPPGITEKLDIPYASASELEKLDVFAPPKARDCPVVIFVHGGGWIIGDKNLLGLYRSVGRFLARHGLVGVLINYQLSPAVKYPEHVKDVARAFAWTRRHIAEYGGDPNRIFLAGHSAGAHLVALLATDSSYLKDPKLKLTAQDRSAIRGVIAVSGVYRIPGPEEFREMIREMADALLEITGKNPVVTALLPVLIQAGGNLNLFEMVFGDDKNVRAQASPINHVRKGLPPFLLLYGERDLPRIKPMTEEFRDALQKAGDPVEMCSIEGHTHNTIVFRLNQPNDPTAQAILKFIHRVLKTPRTGP